MTLSKEVLWKALIDRNPRMTAGDVTFTPDGLKRFFDQVYAQGYAHGKAQAEQAVRASSSIFDDLFR